MDIDGRNRQEDLAKLADAFFENLELDDNEFGGIGVNSKRPFGDSNPEKDILKIIGWEPEKSDHESYSREQGAYARELYSEHLIPYLQETFGRKSQSLPQETPA